MEHDGLKEDVEVNDGLDEEGREVGSAGAASVAEETDTWDDSHLYQYQVLTYRSTIPRQALHPGTEHSGVEGMATIDLYQQQTSFRALNSVGLTVWKSSVTLARYLEERWRREGTFLTGKRVIELGSGCGLAGILATLLGGHTTFTDMEHVLSWTTKNTKHNLDPLRHTYEVKELCWGKTDMSEFRPAFDVVLGADLIYSPKVVLSLLGTLHGVSRADSLVIVAFENHNSTATKLFLVNMPRYFETIELRQKEKLRLFVLKRRDEIEPVEGDAYEKFLQDYSDDTDSDYDE